MSPKPPPRICLTPFVRHAPDIHGSSGLDGTTCLPLPDVPVKGHGAGETVRAMFEALSGTEKGTAWLVPTGALTNAALLFACYPQLAEHLAGASIMGGAVGGGFTPAPMGKVNVQGGGEVEEWFGNWSPFAEFNFYIDPESARAVLGNSVVARKTTLIPLDVTHLFLATEDVQRGLRYGVDEKGKREGEGESDGDPLLTVRKLFLEILTFFTKTYAEVFALTAGPPLHDPLAVMAALMPGVFDDRGGERFEVDVVIDGAHGPKGTEGAERSQCGRTVVRTLGKGEAGVRIPRGLNQGKVWRVLGECLGRAEEAVSGDGGGGNGR